MEPLAALKDQIQILGGLDHINATAGKDGAGDHARQGGVGAVGDHPKALQPHRMVDPYATRVAQRGADRGEEVGEAGAAHSAWAARWLSRRDRAVPC